MTAPLDNGDYRGDGLFPSEREVLDLWDAGWSIPRIAEATGRSRTAVRNVVTRYYNGLEGDRAWARMAADGSAALAAAIAATGKVFA